MKKLLPLLLILTLSTVFAVDMSGKIGFGIGTSRFGDLLKPSLFAMRVGISPKILLEPWLDISQAALKIKVPMTEWSEETEQEFSLQNKGLGAQIQFALRSNEKSNLYGIGGATFGMAELKNVTKYGEYKYTVSLPGTYFVIPLGLGGEYFIIDDHFSVNINAKFGFAKISGKLKTAAEAVEAVLAEYNVPAFSIGNSLFDIYFVWYF